MDRVKLEALIKENPAVAAAAAMTTIRLMNPDTGRQNKAITALRNKDNPSHGKAVGIFQKLKDKFKKSDFEKQKDKVAKGADDWIQKQKDDAHYAKQFGVARTGNELKEDWWDDMSASQQADYIEKHPGSQQAQNAADDEADDMDRDARFAADAEDEKDRGDTRNAQHFSDEPEDDSDDETQSQVDRGDANDFFKNASDSSWFVPSESETQELTKDMDDKQLGGLIASQQAAVDHAKEQWDQEMAQTQGYNPMGGPTWEDTLKSQNQKLAALQGEKERRNPTARTGKELSRREAKQYIRRNKMKISEDILRKVIREEIKSLMKEDAEAFSQPIPAVIDRYMKKFIDAVSKGNLNRKRKLAILGRTIVALRLDPQEVSKYARLVKREL